MAAKAKAPKPALKQCEFCAEKYNPEKDGRVVCDFCCKALCRSCQMYCPKCKGSFCDAHAIEHGCEGGEDEGQD